MNKKILQLGITKLHLCIIMLIAGVFLGSYPNMIRIRAALLIIIVGGLFQIHFIKIDRELGYT